MRFKGSVPLGMLRADTVLCIYSQNGNLEEVQKGCSCGSWPSLSAVNYKVLHFVELSGEDFDLSTWAFFFLWAGNFEITTLARHHSLSQHISLMSFSRQKVYNRQLESTKPPSAPRLM